MDATRRKKTAVNDQEFKALAQKRRKRRKTERAQVRGLIERASRRRGGMRFRNLREQTGGTS